MEISTGRMPPIPTETPIPMPESKVVDAPGAGVGDSAVKITEERTDPISSSGVREIDEADLRRDEEIDKLVSAALSYPAPPPPEIE